MLWRRRARIPRPDERDPPRQELLRGLVGRRSPSATSARAAIYLGLPLALIVARYTITRWRLASTRFLFAMLAVVVVLMLGVAPAHRRLPHHPTSVEGARRVAAGRGLTRATWALYVPDRRGHRSHVAGTAAHRERGGGEVGVGGGEHCVPPAEPQHRLLARPRGQPHVLHHPPVPKRSQTRRDACSSCLTARSGSSMLWQAETGMWFRMTGGYLERSRPTTSMTAAARSLWSGETQPKALRSFLTRPACRRGDRRPGQAPQWTHALAAMG